MAPQPSNSGARVTRTTRYLLGQRRAQGFDGEILASPVLPHHRDDHQRLVMHVTPKLSYDPSDLADRLGTEDDALFFIDTSFVDLRREADVWDALLSHPNSIVLLPLVRDELRGWLDSHPDHPLARALAEDHRAVRDDEGVRFSSDPSLLAAHVYYVRLLGLRAKAFEVGPDIFEAQVGREPRDEVELDGFLHRWLGERGYLLAKKGARAEGPQKFTDESVVYGAVSTAILTGRRTFILTRDEDLQEHFYKLLWLLDTHYRGMLLADAYLADLGRFRRREWPTVPELDEAFPAGGTLLERSDDDLLEILPSPYHSVSVGCLVAADSLTEMYFALKPKCSGCSTPRAEPVA